MQEREQESAVAERERSDDTVLHLIQGAPLDVQHKKLFPKGK